MGEYEIRKQLSYDTVPVKFAATVDPTDPLSYWLSKEERLHDELKNLEWWESRTPDERRALTSIVKEGLSAAYDIVEEWVPVRTRLSESGDRLTITMEILYTDLPEAVEVDERFSSKRMKEIAKHAQAFLDEEAA